jgi:hypothetical protein
VTVNSASSRPAPATAPPAQDRRSGGDRRKVDKGPPGKRERRVSLEPRRPEVTESEMTPSEWDRLQELAAAPPKKKR